MEFAEPLSNGDGKAQKIGGGDTLQVLAVLLHGRLEFIKRGFEFALIRR